MALNDTQIQQLYTAYLGRPADQAGINYWKEQGVSEFELRANLANDNQPEYVELYGNRTREELVTAIYQNMFGREPEEAGLEYWVNGDGASVPASELQQLFISAASEEDIAAFNAKVADDLSNVTPLPPEPGQEETIMLTQRADNETGADGVDTTFRAPVTQNETGSGALANTFETGDVLDGGANSTNTLRADLIGTGTIQDNVQSAPISAETTNIQNVFLRAQMPNQVNTVDAEKMEGVQQWWTDNSRSNIVIEDIRTATDATTFGMRETDPGVGYTAYFNPLYLEGDTSSDSELSLVIQEIDGDQVLAANQLENITVREINFTVGGEAVTLASDDISAANTWDDLAAAIAAELEAQELEGLTISHNGSGLFVIDDAQGRPFEIVEGEALIFGAAADIDVRNRVEVGRLEQEGPTETNVVLDGAGGGSQGGALNIGALSGLRGVEVFNVTVDRDSHLTGMSSVNQSPAVGNLGNGEPNEFLEVVNLVSGENAGDLQVGARTDNSDGRANNNGLTNVREVNAEGFAGDLNIGLQLTDNAIARYLDGASEAVEFNYTGGAGNDLFNIADLSTLDSVSGDQDFAMNVDMGAGDDRLVINVANVNDTTVDGGEGENSIVVSQSHGTTANNTFAEFANFQTYEVEGNVASTAHNFTSMPGVEDVIVATNGTVNTQLINMEAAQSVTVSGKNQTVGNNSTADQDFGTIQLTNDQGTDRTVTLDNTARLSNSTNGVRQDGVLTVDNLTVNSNAQLDGTASAVRNLTIDSDGERSTANAIASLNAATVTSLNLVGDQDLSLNISSLSNQTPASARTALNVDASTLTGDLNLAIQADQIANFTGAGTDTVVGTAGVNDTLMLHGTIADRAVSFTGFEELQFGTQSASMYGDLQLGGQAADGTFDASGVSASAGESVVFNIANVGAAGLTLDNLGSGAEVNLGDAIRDAAGNVVNGQSVGGAVILDSGIDAAATAREATLDVNFLSNLAQNDSQVLTVNNYGTINLDIAKAGDSITAGVGAADARGLTLNLDGDARTLNIEGGDVNGVNADDPVTGDPVYDELTLNAELPNSLSTVDISGYAGEVTLTMLQAATDDVAAADQTDVTFVMSANSATVTLSDFTAIEHNSIFVFTGEKGDTDDLSTWTINNGVGFEVGGEDAATVLDVSAFGITGFTALDTIAGNFDAATGVFTEAVGGTDTRIVSEAQNDDGEISWEIILTGVLEPDVTAGNFEFA